MIKKMLVILLLLSSVYTTQVFASGDKEDESVLVIYSPHKQNLIDLVVDMYEKDTGVNVEVITAGTGELIARLKTESSNPNADIIWGGGAMDTLLPEKALFAEYRSPNESGLVEAFQNKEGYVTRFSAMPSTIVVNTERLAKICGAGASIDGYQSIIDTAKSCPDLRGNISNAKPSKSSSAFEQLINQIWAYAYIEAKARLGKEASVDDIMQRDIDKAWSHVAELIAVYDGKYSAGSGAVITDVAQGETVVALSYEMAAAEAVDASSKLQLVYPVEGSVIKSDGVAVIKGAPHKEEAEKFIDYLLSKKVQNQIKSVYRRAITVDADFEGSPLAPLDSFKVIQDKNTLNSKEHFLSEYSTYFRR